MMTNLKFLQDLKNKQINLWPECKSMALNRIIIKIYVILWSRDLDVIFYFQTNFQELSILFILKSYCLFYNMMIP